MEISRRSEVTPATRDGLLAAGAAELAENGSGTLTVRRVARRAGVSPATAYKVFASKEHLLSAVFLTHLRAAPDEDPTGPGAPVEERLARFVDDLVAGLAGGTALDTALRAVFLGRDPDVRRVRNSVVEDFELRFDRVCGDDLTGDARRAARLLFSGAMVLAGTGIEPADRMREDLVRAVRVLRAEARRDG
ncbi:MULTISPECIES: TetR/AcrR family transcriptional regulator [unclassified Pseudonocardia]|uniref:TetR/AcrR family transcriptional regulator n=1 Tax=unclassified Pseudonocardia TaxID=2619320 RepID=UPI0001FFF0E6|nr:MULTISPECIES: TetR/AcrR family transcriptional regulator [unclassified Pseudonocardia]OLM21409.1 Transcriptional regulator, TetR family [Pseudonocardia sp. Ae707_Ps1]